MAGPICAQVKRMRVAITSNKRLEAYKKEVAQSASNLVEKKPKPKTAAKKATTTKKAPAKKTAKAS